MSEHACDSVCAAVVSVSSAVSFFADEITAGGYTPRPGAAFRPGHSLPKGECNHPHPPQFAIQPRVSGRMGPELRSYHLTGEVL